MVAERGSPSVTPFVRWAIAQSYKVRFTRRWAEGVSGMLTTPAGVVPFSYDTLRRVITLPDRTVAINEYGWESARPTTKSE